MKHSVAVKFLAILLCALSIVSIAGCGFGVLFMENWNLYNMPLEKVKEERLESLSTNIAWNHAQIHAAQTLSNCPREILDDTTSYTSYVPGDYAVSIYQDQELVYSFNDPSDIHNCHTSEHTVAPNYPIVTSQYTQHEGPVTGDLPHVTEASLPVQPAAVQELPAATYPPGVEETYPSIEFDVQERALTPTAPYMDFADSGEAAAAEAEAAAPTSAAVTPEWTLARDKALKKVAGQNVVYSAEHSETFHNAQGIPYEVTYVLDYYTGPEYLVKIYLEETAVLGTEYALMSLLYPYRGSFIPLLLGSLLVFAVTLVYLFTAAGHAPGGEIRPAGLNVLPLDLYAVIAITGIGVILALLISLMDNLGYGYWGIWDNLPLCMLLLGSGIFGIALLAIGMLFAYSAQLKLKNGYWWRHSLCGRCLQRIAAFFRWIRRGLQYFYRGTRAVVRLLPLCWQWLVTAFLMVLVPFLLFVLCQASWGFGEFFWGLLCFVSVVCDIALVCYGGWCFGILLKGAKHMAQGDLNHQINTRYLLGCFKEFALHLNALVGAAQKAAEQQTKSERMKTELITNVSHDIKTPLTSIINYVDLMKKPHSEEDHAVYLEVLDRQSLRLKKLVEDLMDMSKASSGNMSVELGQVDAVEAVNQALGEFADKLAQVNLTPLFRHPDRSLVIRADGRLLWRVLSNLLSNAVKYSLPGTRLYLDLTVVDNSAILDIKNISREQLNINAEELMERFVRGDTSRNTEGSGLGLNIAKSLAELQGGRMHLLVDGDLFKVSLIFPLI